MPIYKGSQKIKSFIRGNNVKIGKIYKGATLVYQSSIPVTYIVDSDISYTEMLQNGTDALSPTTFTPEKEGWIFAGWSESATSSTVLESKIINSESITLYAVFKKEITLSYNANGGSSTPNSSTGYAIYILGITTNPTFILANAISRSNYKFKGWRQGSVSGTSYDANAVVTLSESTIFYASFALSYASGSASANWSASDISSDGTRVISQYFTFPAAFDHVPSVSGSRSWSGYSTDNITVLFSNVSTTGFLLTVDCWQTGSKTYGLTVYWSAS